MFRRIVDFIRDLYHQPEGNIPLHAPVFKGNEKKYLEECIDSTYVRSVGDFVNTFEQEIAVYTGASKAVACVNGTSALYLALKIVGVEMDTEVITQPLTFVATANAIAYCGSHPVFLDIDTETMGLSPSKLKIWLEQNIVFKNPIKKDINRKYETDYTVSINKNTGRRISACVPMHTFGHPCKIEEIFEICRDYNIPLVEDATESLGSFYKEQHTGTFGIIGVLSFNGNKIITTGGGGMLLCRNEELAKKAKHLNTQAKVPHSWEFVHDDVGYNFRMPNINAALGLAQLEQLSTFINIKREIANEYNKFFKEIDIEFVKEPDHTFSNYWLNAILFNNNKERNSFLKYTNENGIMTRPPWKLMSRLSMYANAQCGNLANAEWIADRLVNIPSSVIIE